MKVTTKLFGKDFYKPYKESVAGSEQLLAHLNIETLSANYYECSEEWNLEPRRVNNSYWSWITSGIGKLFFGENNKEYIVGEGDFILFPQYCLHSLKPECGSSMSMINVHFHAQLYGILDILSYYDLGGVYKVKKLFEFHSYEAAREYCLKPTGWQRSLTDRIELILLNLLRNREVFSVLTGKISRLQPALLMIDSYLSNPNLSVADMAVNMDISEVYLRTLFRQQLGISPIKYLRRQRIDKACALLRETVMPIRMIAEKCGFREVQFFYRVFRHMTGVTPANYRKNPEF